MAISVTAVARSTLTAAPRTSDTTASFTPAVGELLVACVTCDLSASTAVVMSDSLGGTWTQRARHDGTVAPTGAQVTVISTRPVTAATAMTVTASGSGAFYVTQKVYRVAGSSLAVGATGTGGSTTANITPTAFTSTVANSYIFATGCTFNGSANPTSSDLTIDAFETSGVGDDLAGLAGYKALGAVGSKTFNFNTTASPVTWHWAAIEVVESAQAAAGIVAGTTAASGAVTAKMVAAGTVAGTTALTGNVTVLSGPPPQVAAGTVVATSGASGNPIKMFGAAGVVAATSGLSGTVRARMVASGTVPATSSASGAVVSKLLAAGTVAATSIVSGKLVVTGKPGQGNEVLELFNPDEVLTGGRVTYYQFDLLDREENLIGQLQGVESGEVSIDAYSAVKGTGRLTVYTDPAYRHMPEGQPDFLGVRTVTYLGPMASSVPPPIPVVDGFTTPDVDGTDISIGDNVMLTDSIGQPKESTIFTVVLKTFGFGYTNIYFSPDAQAPPAAGDLLKVVSTGNVQQADWLNARIRPMIRIARLGGGDDPQGTLVPAGVFLCAAPVENWDATGLRREIELVDKLSILDQDIASGDPNGIAAYAAPAGSNVIGLVRALIEETGEATPAIADDSKVLAAPMLWDVGTTRLKIINDLLDAGGYFSLFCDGYGQYQAVPYVQPSDRVPVYESLAPFSDGEQSLMDPAWTRDRDIYSIPNRYLVVGQGDGTTPALTSLATNVDPNSPYSFPSRGRWITQVEIGVEAVDQSALDTIARARLSNATSVTNQMTVQHIFLPDLHVNSVVKFVNPGSGLDLYCYVVHTTIPLDPLKLCTTVMRVVG